MSVGCGCDIGTCVSGCCLEAVFLKRNGGFGGCGCAQNVPLKSFQIVWCGAILAADMKLSRRHFSWQAQCFVRAGGVEVNFRDSWWR